jgi:hypothetical protein
MKLWRVIWPHHHSRSSAAPQEGTVSKFFCCQNEISHVTWCYLLSCDVEMQNNDVWWRHGRVSIQIVWEQETNVICVVTPCRPCSPVGVHRPRRPTDCVKRSRNWKSGQGPTKGCRAVDRWRVHLRIKVVSTRSLEHPGPELRGRDWDGRRGASTEQKENQQILFRHFIISYSSKTALFEP